MGKKRQKKSENVVQLDANEESRIRISQTLEKFRAAPDQVYKFDPNLSKKERAFIHELCRKMGMKSKSSGSGKGRCISVSKIVKKARVRKIENGVTHLYFSEESRLALKDLFMQYPPQDEELDSKQGEECHVEIKRSFERKDNLFLKPLLTKEQISRKLETLSARCKSDAKLRKIFKEKLKLPITSFKDEIISAVVSHQIVLISGETGCGKTTQVPQFLLDHSWANGESCKVVCTQPRRISATSVAERICCERGQIIGDDIGYKIRLESKGGRNSSILFCTNGILLRVLVANGTFKSEGRLSDGSVNDDGFQATHIIVDEVHERDHNSDMLLAIIRDFLHARPSIKLILMSATLDSERFSAYFGGCPVIRVPGFTYPVKSFYLDDVLSMLKSGDNCTIGPSPLQSGIKQEQQDLQPEDKTALDEAIDLAWASDEFELLSDLVYSVGTPKVYNYQHSLTGLSPLMVFAAKGKVDDVRTLLSLGADCNLKSAEGLSALQFAEQGNNQECVEVIKREPGQYGASNCSRQKELVDNYLAGVNPEFVDVDLIIKLLRKICTDCKEGAILVFLPGWDEINRTREKLLSLPFFKDGSKFIIICLHSMVPSAEQKRVFKQPPQGCRKIILSTNIAETSITIEDVVCVVDCGRMKEKSYDPYSNVSTFHSSWISRASAKQREGRAGRCQPGICYHIYSRTRAESLPDFQVPEIRRMPVEELCLQVKMLDPGCDIEEYLQKTLDPPCSEAIRNAICTLREIGALTQDEHLTQLGQKLGCIPVHPLTSKMLFFAILMDCLDPALTIASVVAHKDPFITPLLPSEKKKAAAAKLEFASLYGSEGDHLAAIAAYECWKIAKQRGQEARLCSHYFLSPAAMSTLDSMRKQLKSELVRSGFIKDGCSGCSSNAHNIGILHSVLVASSYPMIGKLIRLKKGKQLHVETVSGTQVRLHPHSLNRHRLSNGIDEWSLAVYDEITRSDGGLFVRNCTVVGLLPVLLLSKDISVAPLKKDNNGEDDESENDVEDDEIMSSPTASVDVIIDRWLHFKASAIDVAQMYCLRERLSAAILHRVTCPPDPLPPALDAAVRAVAYILSLDGMSGAPGPASLNGPMPPASENGANYATGGTMNDYKNPNGFLKSLMDQCQRQARPLYHLPVFAEELNGNGQRGQGPFRQVHPFSGGYHQPLPSVGPDKIQKHPGANRIKTFHSKDSYKRHCGNTYR